MEPPELSPTWDAGDMGCGELLLALRGRLLALPPGAILRVIARDPGAPEEMPSWCRLTGHRLLCAEHPSYTIQRKEH
jgi:tRNA 2-thiouridine synthesizing protein A